MKPKYQVFVSSTYEDLKEERDQVIKTCLELGHIPVGMEMFSAGDDSQWRVIERTIRQCDYYLVIVANRYGTVSEDGRSFTEMEYDFAAACNIPILGFVLDRSAKWEVSRSETDHVKMEKLDLFKTKITARISKYWTSGEDLAGKCGLAIAKAIEDYPRPGWIPATEAASSNVADELARLSAENQSLRKLLDQSEVRAADQITADAEYLLRSAISVYLSDEAETYRFTGEYLEERTQNCIALDAALKVAKDFSDTEKPDFALHLGFSDRVYRCEETGVIRMRDESGLKSCQVESVSGVNAMFRELAKRGLIKRHNNTGTMVGSRYRLTPSGEASFSRAMLACDLE